MKPIFTDWASAGAAADKPISSASAQTAAPKDAFIWSPCSSSRPGSAELDEHVVAVELDREGLDVLGHRRAQRLAGLDLEATGMERAFDDAVLEIGVRPAGIG